MSIQSEITRISGNVSDALGAIAAKGVTVPAGSNSDDLADLIEQITGGGSAILITKTITANGTYNASFDHADGYSSVTASVPNVFTITDTPNTTGTTAVITAGTSGGFIASGTYTGNGAATCTVPVGKKMPKTNFLFHMYAPGGTEYVYNSTYKYAELTCIITDTIASYDLSSNGTKGPVYTGNITWSVNNSGTITNVTNYSTGYLKYIRSATTAVSYQGQSGRPSIIRSNNGFSIEYIQGNNSYAFVSGLIYNWELYYFGSNPSTDIVEVE